VGFFVTDRVILSFSITKTQDETFNSKTLEGEVLGALRQTSL